MERIRRNDDTFCFFRDTFEISDKPTCHNHRNNHHYDTNPNFSNRFLINNTTYRFVRDKNPSHRNNNPFKKCCQRLNFSAPIIELIIRIFSRIFDGDKIENRNPHIEQRINRARENRNGSRKNPDTELENGEKKCCCCRDNSRFLLNFHMRILMIFTQK